MSLQNRDTYCLIGNKPIRLKRLCDKTGEESAGTVQLQRLKDTRQWEGHPWQPATRMLLGDHSALG